MVSQPGSVQPFFCAVICETKQIIIKRYPTKPVKVQNVYESFNHTRDFSAENAKLMLQNFIKAATDLLNGTTTVTAQVNQESASMLFVGESYQLSLAYTEGGVQS